MGQSLYTATIILGAKFDGPGPFSTRVELDGETVDVTVTYSNGHIEIMGGGTALGPDYINYNGKLGGIKFDYGPNGWIIGGTLDKTGVGVRVGAGTTDNNLYIEIKVGPNPDFYGGYLDAGVYPGGGQFPGYVTDQGYINPTGYVPIIVNYSGENGFGWDPSHFDLSEYPEYFADMSHLVQVLNGDFIHYDPYNNLGIIDLGDGDYRYVDEHGNVLPADARMGGLDRTAEENVLAQEDLEFWQDLLGSGGDNSGSSSSDDDWNSGNNPIPDAFESAYDAYTDFISPIILDLDGDGVEIMFDGRASFDMDSDGYLEQTSWAAADDGFLVIDLAADGSVGAGDGIIDQAEEIAFSLWTDTPDATDLQALAEATDADGNLIFNSDTTPGADGGQVLDANDTIWGHLHVWQDLDQGGQREWPMAA